MGFSLPHLILKNIYIMKTTLKKVIAVIVLFVATLEIAYAQPSADLILTGGPNASYPGFPVAGTFNITLQNNTNVNIPIGSFEITLTLPTGFTFDLFYPGIPAGWTYLRSDGQNINLVLTSILSGTPPSYTSFSVPFTTTAAVNNQPYLGQIQRLIPTYQDPDLTNNSPSGTVTVSNIVLPVDFVSINATVKNCEAKVDWVTANQVHLKQFELEYSLDGISYVTGKILPINSVGAYSGTVPVSGDQAYFFRVKAVDLDGKYKYSSIAIVKADCNGKQGAYSMYPNPVLKGHLVNLASTTTESTTYRILDMAGKIVQEGRFTGTTTFQVTNGGAYIVDLQSATTSTKYKLVVQ
jgi:hypothetical protein